METWLIVLIGILVSVGIISLVYSIFLQRRIAVVAKKVDYLVEDLIYKSEMLSSTVESIVKLSNFTDSIEAVLNNNQDKLIELFTRNKKLIQEVTTDMNQIFRKEGKVYDIKK